MKNLINFNNVEDRVLCLRDRFVLLDSDVAAIYGVETKRINEAVRNNPEKFPTGYIFTLDKEEWQQISLRSKFSTLKTGRGQHIKICPQSLYRKRFVYAGNHSEKSDGDRKDD